MRGADFEPAVPYGLKFAWVYIAIFTSRSAFSSQLIGSALSSGTDPWLGFAMPNRGVASIDSIALLDTYNPPFGGTKIRIQHFGDER